MANWKYTFDISDIYKDKGFSIVLLGQEIAKRLRRKFPNNDEVEEIADRFDSITGYDDVTPTEEFDDAMNELYDWADTELEPYDAWPRNKQCWVKTR